MNSIEVKPVVLGVRPDLIERQLRHPRTAEELKLLLCRFQLRPPCIVDAAALDMLALACALDHEADRDAGLDAEHVVLRSRQLRVCAHVAAQVHDVNVVEFLRHHLAKAVEGAAFDEAVGW